MKADPLRTRAAEIVATLRAAQAAQADAQAANDAEQKRLATLASEITSREAKLDPEDLSAVADLQARQRQHELLSAKAERDAARRLADARRKAGELIADAKLPEFFKEAYHHHFEEVRAKLLPYIAEHLPLEVEGLTRTVNGLSGIARLHQWSRYTPTPERALTILEQFVSGTPLWRCA